MNDEYTVNTLDGLFYLYDHPLERPFGYHTSFNIEMEHKYDYTIEDIENINKNLNRVICPKTGNKCTLNDCPLFHKVEPKVIDIQSEQIKGIYSWYFKHVFTWSLNLPKTLCKYVDKTDADIKMPDKLDNINETMENGFNRMNNNLDSIARKKTVQIKKYSIF